MFWLRVGIVNPNVDRFFDGPCLPPVLPAYDVETVVL